MLSGEGEPWSVDENDLFVPKNNVTSAVFTVGGTFQSPVVLYTPDKRASTS